MPIIIIETNSRCSNRLTTFGGGFVICLSWCMFREGKGVVTLLTPLTEINKIESTFLGEKG